MAEDNVDGRPGRQTVVEINDLKAAAIADPGASGDVPRLADGHRRNVQPPYIQTSPSQPDAAQSLAAGEIKRLSGGREHFRVGREHRRRLNHPGLYGSVARISLIPAALVLPGHRRPKGL